MTSFKTSTVLVLLVFAVICGPLILSQSHSNYSWDEQQYHLPAVRQIEANWPKLDISADSLSATAPGYHYFLATWSQVTGSQTRVLRFLNWCVSAGLLVVLLRQTGLRDLRCAALVVAPLFCSNFFVKSASWVVTDNAALLVMLLAILSLTPGGNSSVKVASIWSTLAVFTRQTYLWLILPIAWCAWFDGKSSPRLARMGRLALAFMPVLVVGILVLHWGGLVPPRWTAASVPDSSFSLTPIAYILAMFGIFGPCFVWLADSRSLAAWMGSRLVRGGILFGFVVGLVARSDYDYEAGRWGGYLWEFSRMLPTPAGRSPLIMLLAAWGGGVLGTLVEVLLGRIGKRGTLLWVIAIGAWSISFLPNRQIFQRYYEPPILIFLIIWFGWLSLSHASIGKRWKPLIGLSVAQIVLTFATAHWRALG